METVNIKEMNKKTPKLNNFGVFLIIALTNGSESKIINPSLSK
jgi:hypothetical protein